ncbi:MAG: hypothetical protein HY868_04680 [Chloroflexi bacterium]|nr:hypothetical protein [Chloroflexota bacterium]
MYWRIGLGILIALLLVAGVVAVGGYAYSMGVAQGMTTPGKLDVPSTGVAPLPYWYRPWGWHYGGFGLLSCFFPLLFFFLFFGLMRAFFWRGHWGMHHGRKWEGGVPPMFEEWHRKMHEPQGTTK